MLLIFHLVFLKFIKSSVPYFPMVCDLFALFCYSHFFCGLFTFFNLFLYFRKHCPLRKVFTLYFLMIGIFFTPIFCQNIVFQGWKLPYPQFDHFPDLTEIEIRLESIFYESLHNRNNHAKHNFGSCKGISRQYWEYAGCFTNFIKKQIKTFSTLRK